MKLPKEARELFKAFGKEGGKKRNARMSAKRRSELARKAVQARWAKAKAKKAKGSRKK